MNFTVTPPQRQVPQPESEVHHALQTVRAYRDNNRLLRKLLCEQEERHQAEMAAKEAQHREEIEFIMECRRGRVGPTLNEQGRRGHLAPRDVSPQEIHLDPLA